MILRDALLVFLGAGLGGVCRWGIGAATLAVFGIQRFPVATFLANFIACALIGLFAGWSLKGGLTACVPVKLFLISGFLGGLSTMSAFGLETVTLFRRGDFWLAGTNIFLTLSVCLIALGIMLKTAEA